MPTPRSLLLLSLALALTLLTRVSAEHQHRAHARDPVPVRAEEPRDVQPLSGDHLRQFAQGGPADWTSTAEGHLGKILIPRARE
jgi:hypothetical protein